MTLRPFQNSMKNGLHYRFNIILLLIVVVPTIGFYYLLHHHQIALDVPHLLLIGMLLVLILAGVTILRYIFDGIQTLVNFVKHNSHSHDGGSVAALIEKDVADLSKISALFESLMGRFEDATTELNQRVTELNSLQEITEAAKKTLQVDELLQLVMDRAMMTVKAQRASIFQVENGDGQERLRLIASCPAMDGVAQGDDFESPFLKNVLSEGKALIVSDIASDPRTHKPNDSRYGSPSFLSMPLSVQGRIIAILNLSEKSGGKVFTEGDERIVAIMVGEIGFALENAFLHRMVREQLVEISAKNARLEKEAADRSRVDETLLTANVELLETNERLTAAYTWMREHRDNLRKHLYKEEIGFIVDRQGHISAMTERALEVTGLARTELAGQDILTLIDEGSQDAFRNELKEGWMGIAHNIPVTLKVAAGEDKTYEATLTRLTGKDGRGILVILR